MLCIDSRVLPLDWIPCLLTNVVPVSMRTLRKWKRGETKIQGKLLKMGRKEGRAKVVPTRGQKGLQHHIHRGNDLKPNNIVQHCTCQSNL